MGEDQTGHALTFTLDHSKGANHSDLRLSR
jgi:hypothetical protein